MSYILDALRKADAQRELGTAPELLGTASPAVAAPGPAPVPASRAVLPWRWLIAGAAIPVVALIAWRYLMTPATEPPATLAAARTEAPRLAPPTPAPLPPPAVPAAPEPAPTPAPAAQPAPEPEPVREPAPEPAPAPPPPPPARKKLPPKPPPAKRAAAPQVTPAPQATPPRPLAELPEDLRRLVPAMTIGGSVYASQPADRMLVVNGQVVREGAALSPDLRLETIGQKTAVFSVRGQRFEMKL